MADVLGPSGHVALVFAALLSFAVLTTAAVVAVGVTPIAEAVPESPSSMPDQPGDAIQSVPSADGPSADGSSANATTSGTVTRPDGEPVSNATVVLAPSPEPMFEKATPDELASVVDAESDSALYVTKTGENGTYAVGVPAGEYDAIALADRNVSAIRTVNATRNATLDLAVRDERPIRPDVTGSQAGAGERATVTVRFYNNDADAKTFDVAFTRLPPGWTVASVDGTASSVEADEPTFHFENVSSGAWAIAEIEVRVPTNATPGERYRFESMATEPTDGPNATARILWTGNATVLVPGNDTTVTTQTDVSGDEKTDDGATGDDPTAAASTATAATTDSGEAGSATTDDGEGATTADSDTTIAPTEPGGAVPGFEVALALAAFVGTAGVGVLAARRSQ